MSGDLDQTYVGKTPAGPKDERELLVRLAIALHKARTTELDDKDVTYAVADVLDRANYMLETSVDVTILAGVEGTFVNGRSYDLRSERPELAEEVQKGMAARGLAGILVGGVLDQGEVRALLAAWRVPTSGPPKASLGRFKEVLSNERSGQGLPDSSPIELVLLPADGKLPVPGSALGPPIKLDDDDEDEKTPASRGPTGPEQARAELAKLAQRPKSASSATDSTEVKSGSRTLVKKSGDVIAEDLAQSARSSGPSASWLTKGDSTDRRSASWVDKDASGKASSWLDESSSEDDAKIQDEYRQAFHQIAEEPDSSAKGDAEPATRPEPKPEPKAELKPEPKSEPKAELKPEPKPELKPEIKPEPKAELKPEPKPEPAKAPVSTPVPVSSPTSDTLLGRKAAGPLEERELLLRLASAFRKRKVLEETDRAMTDAIADLLDRANFVLSSGGEVTILGGPGGIAVNDHRFDLAKTNPDAARELAEGLPARLLAGFKLTGPIETDDLKALLSAWKVVPTGSAKASSARFKEVLEGERQGYGLSGRGPIAWIALPADGKLPALEKARDLTAEADAAALQASAAAPAEPAVSDKAGPDKAASDKAATDKAATDKAAKLSGPIMRAPGRGPTGPVPTPKGTARPSGLASRPPEKPARPGDRAATPSKPAPRAQEKPVAEKPAPRKADSTATPRPTTAGPTTAGPTTAGPTTAGPTTSGPTPAATPRPTSSATPAPTTAPTAGPVGGDTLVGKKIAGPGEERELLIRLARAFIKRKTLDESDRDMTNAIADLLDRANFLVNGSESGVTVILGALGLHVENRRYDLTRSRPEVQAELGEGASARMIAGFRFTGVVDQAELKALLAAWKVAPSGSPRTSYARFREVWEGERQGHGLPEKGPVEVLQVPPTGELPIPKDVIEVEDDEEGGTADPSVEEKGSGTAVRPTAEVIGEDLENAASSSAVRRAMRSAEGAGEASEKDKSSTAVRKASEIVDSVDESFDAEDLLNPAKTPVKIERPSGVAVEDLSPDATRAGIAYARLCSRAARVFNTSPADADKALAAVRRAVVEILRGLENAYFEDRLLALTLAPTTPHDARARHAANTAVFTAVAGRACGVNRVQLADLVAAAALHDDGDIEAASKPDRWPRTLHRALEGSVVSDLTILRTVLAFERTGPRGAVARPVTNQKRARLESRIVACACAYDDAVQGSGERAAARPDLALDRLAPAGHDPQAAKALGAALGKYPRGTLVLVGPDKLLGVVLACGGRRNDKPRVRVFADADGNAVPAKEVELAQAQGMSVLKVEDPTRLGIDARAHVVAWG